MVILRNDVVGNIDDKFIRNGVFRRTSYIGFCYGYFCQRKSNKDTTYNALQVTKIEMCKFYIRFNPGYNFGWLELKVFINIFSSN